MSLAKSSRQLKRLKYLIAASFFITICTSVLMLLNSSRGSTIATLSTLLFLVIAHGPNLMHIFMCHSLYKNYFPQKEVPRSFFISFHIVSVFAWVVCAGMFFLTVAIVISLLGREEKIELWNVFSILAFATTALLVFIMPFQLMAAYKLLSMIQENHKKRLLESFN